MGSLAQLAPCLALRYDPDQLDADLSDAADDGVETEAIIALGTDARVPDAELGPGRVNRGWWADSVLDDGDQLGSALWLLERAPMGDEALARAEALVSEKLALMVRDGRLESFSAGVRASGSHIEVAPTLVLPDGSVRTFGALTVN